MQTHRLFEIIYLLLDKGQMTASELASHFEVSVRTIYRDIDRLSISGVPIYTNVGKNGGIALMDGYTLDKSILSDAEQNEILMALQSLKAVEYPDPDGLLTKLGTFFKKNQQSWIEVDFTGWAAPYRTGSAQRSSKTPFSTGAPSTFPTGAPTGRKASAPLIPSSCCSKATTGIFRPTAIRDRTIACSSCSASRICRCWGTPLSPIPPSPLPKQLKPS